MSTGSAAATTQMAYPELRFLGIIITVTTSHIQLLGVTTHNLKNISVSFPLGKLTTVSGVSGSGKSSLVFDTLYGEAYRRYLESLSSFARQYMQTSLRPKLLEALNLPAAISVRQSRSGTSNRSTVATLTELNQLLEIIFTEMSEIKCPKCSKRIQAGQLNAIQKQLFAKFTSQDLLVLAPLKLWKDMLPAKELIQNLQTQGFARIFQDGAVLRLENLADLDFQKDHVVVDRLTLSEETYRRFLEASESAFKLGRGFAGFYSNNHLTKDALGLRCSECELVFRSQEAALFSFNHPLGACSSCQGFSKISVIDWKKVTPDLDESIATRGVAPFNNFGSHKEAYEDFLKSAKKRRFDPKTPFNDYTKDDWKWFREGDSKTFRGMQGYFDWLESKKFKPHYRIHAFRFRKYEGCPVCKGERFGEESLRYVIGEKTIAQAYQLSVLELSQWISTLPQPNSPRAKEALHEITARLGYLLKIGLSYLSLNRVSSSLSGGELQRIQMSKCLGSHLTETLYCLDEPSSGLHPADIENLGAVLKDLRDLGNTVVVVEHENALIAASDYLVEIGPGAGSQGGEVVYSGPLHSYQRNLVVFDFAPPLAKQEFFCLNGVKTHNLKSIDVKIPLGALTVVCGVSGSGKSSLVRHTFAPALAKAIGQDDLEDAEAVYESLKPAALIKKIEQIDLVGQGSIGRSSRSNIATYLGAFDGIRKCFFAEAQNQKSKLTPGDFSFNVPGGRCEECKGLGFVEDDLSFLGTIPRLCPTCLGERFREEVLKVTYKGYSIRSLLNLTVSQSLEVFRDVPKLKSIFQSVVDLGLGYMVLGQQTSDFSGGEAQRLKLLKLFLEASKAEGSKKMVLIFDEPSTGLADADVWVLLMQLKRLCREGHTVVVVEHHLGLIKSADYLIEVGPKAADEGGELIYQGHPSGLKTAERSLTAKYL